MLYPAANTRDIIVIKTMSSNTDALNLYVASLSPHTITVL